MMKNLEFKLVDNTYGPAEAKEVMLALIKSKIKFLNHQIFSTYERFGSDTSHLEKRVLELSRDRDQLIKQFKEIESSNVEINIDCTAKLEIKKAVSA